MKTDPRVKSQTQRSADEAISEMLRHNRGLKPKWTPKAPHVKIKKKKTKLKIKASFDIETLQFFGSIFLFVVVIFVLFLSYSYSFGTMGKPKVRIMPELNNNIIRNID
jgi:hypothetical protein|tara:strand:- start:11 stop:334 length:324 start_codon:yes stop_codon:yes gene_type:complete